LELLLTRSAEAVDIHQKDPEGRTLVMVVISDAMVSLVQNAVQSALLKESLASIQMSQPQLTDLTCSASDLGGIESEGEGDENCGISQQPGTGSIDESSASRTSSPTIGINGSPPPKPPHKDIGSGINRHNSIGRSSVERQSMGQRRSASNVAQLSAVDVSKLTSLAQASPLTIECLKQLGLSAAKAELEFSLIRRDPLAYEYYLFFIQATTSTVLASQSIASGMISDARQSTGERVMQGIDTAAQAVSWMGAPLVTGIGRYLVSIPNTLDRQRTIRRIVEFFPSVDSHKYIEILARELTVCVCKDIHELMREAKRHPKQGIVDRVMKAVEWLQTATNLTPIQALACTHSARLIDTMMKTHAPTVVDISLIERMIQWACNKPLEEVRLLRSSSNSTDVADTSESPVRTPASNGLGGVDIDPVFLGDGSDQRSALVNDGHDARSNQNSPNTAYADKEVVDKRIFELERKLSSQMRDRELSEKRQKVELEELKKKLKGLDVVNHIFGGMNAGGGLVNAQTAEALHHTVEQHLGRQLALQSEQGEVLRDLVLKVDLLVEDNDLIVSHSNTPLSQGSAKGSLSPVPTPMGAWVNKNVSYTADGAIPLSVSSKPVRPQKPGAVTAAATTTTTTTATTAAADTTTSVASDSPSASPVAHKSVKFVGNLNTKAEVENSTSGLGGCFESSDTIHDGHVTRQNTSERIRQQQEQEMVGTGGCSCVVS
jgi:hypothetical protein